MGDWRLGLVSRTRAKGRMEISQRKGLGKNDIYRPLETWRFINLFCIQRKDVVDGWMVRGARAKCFRIQPSLVLNGWGSLGFGFQEVPVVTTIGSRRSCF